MMDKDSTFYQKLVDLYAGRELPEELEADMVDRSATDPRLDMDMSTLRATYDRLHAEPAPEFSEDTAFRILMKIQNWSGEDFSPVSEQQTNWQYRLPI